MLNHLLERDILLKVSGRPGPHVRDILREQGMHQTHEFARGKDESTFVLVFGHFLVLAPVIGFELQVEHSEGIGAKDEVVTPVGIAHLGQAGVLRDRATRGVVVPGQAEVLSEVFVFGEAGDVGNLGQDTGRDDRAKSWDGDEGVGERGNGSGDLLVEPLHEAADEADVIPKRGEGESDHLVQLRVNGVGGIQGLLDGSCGGVRVVEAASSGAGDEVGELLLGESAQFGSGELSEEGDAGCTEEVGEGLDPFPVAVFEEGEGLETHLAT